jgi:hypothetical protein
MNESIDFSSKIIEHIIDSNRVEEFRGYSLIFFYLVKFLLVMCGVVQELILL